MSSMDASYTNVYPADCGNAYGDSVIRQRGGSGRMSQLVRWPSGVMPSYLPPAQPTVAANHRGRSDRETETVR